MFDPRDEDFPQERDPAAAAPGRFGSIAGHVAGAVAAALVVLVATGSPSPRIGDILTIEPRSPRIMASTARMDALHTSSGTPDSPARVGAGCVLKLAVMAVDGGSLMLHGYDPRRMRWNATWYGGSTSQMPKESCGRQAEVSIHQGDVGLLYRSLRPSFWRNAAH